MTDTYVIKLRGIVIKETRSREEFRVAVDHLWNLSEISVAVEKVQA